jgi:GNAT superfamily N-acetyltransferase
MNRPAPGDILVRDLTYADATAEMATGIAVVQRDAYRARFPGVEQVLIEDEYVANPLDPHHTQETIANLGLGPEHGYHWVAAVHRSMGYNAVLGFGLASAGESEINLVELHTHPEAQRLGLGSAIAARAIRAALTSQQFTASGLTTPVSLYVARWDKNDPTEHPAAWYRASGFQSSGEGLPTTMGGYDLPTERMVGSAGRVLAALDAQPQRY